MDRYWLERDGEVLGVITCEPWDGNQGSWPDWGRLDPSPESRAAIELLAVESHLHDEAVRTESAGGDPADLLAEAARVQAEFMRPGVWLVSLVSGSRQVLSECHAEGGRVFWR